MNLSIAQPLLEVKDMHISFFTHVGEVRAIRGVDFHVNSGESIGIVGESGSGKSVTSLAILGLLPYPGKITEGSISFQGEDLLSKGKQEMRKIRGNRISMIFQDPMTSLNPVFTVGEQIMEVLRVHRRTKGHKETLARAIEMLDLVGIPSAKTRVHCYPHEFSGGMRQRAMIAMSLACEPTLLIADEPTTALDVTIQAQILDLMNDLREKIGTSIMLITHDLGVVSETCSRVLVMYGGQIMEESPADQLFENPLHPYTKGLLRSIPLHGGGGGERLIPIAGTPPDLLRPPLGCPFVERCNEAMKICLQHPPAFYSPEGGRRVACWRLSPEMPLKGGVSDGKG